MGRPVLGDERFRGEAPTWGDPDRLAGMVSRATGGPTEVSHDLWISGDGLGPPGRPEDAALLVLRSEMKTDKWQQVAIEGP